MAAVVVARPPPRRFDPSQRPKFLKECSEQDPAVGPSTPREATRSAAVSAAAAVALAGPSWAGLGVATRTSTLGASSKLRRLRHSSAPSDLLALMPAPLDPPPATTAAAGNDTASAAVQKGSATLHFGDVVRLLRAGDSAALSTVLPGHCDEVEDHLTRQLEGSGRQAGGFVAVTAVPPRPGADGADQCRQRGVWEVFRANPLDGLVGDTVHYGQPVRIGQRPAQLGGDEMLLSCEPPQHSGGADEPYLVLGRYAAFGHADPRIEGRKTFDTTFRLLPLLDLSACDGQPVDLREPVLLAPVGPAAYLHRARYVQLAPGLTAASGRQVHTTGDREFAVEAVTWERMGRRDVTGPTKQLPSSLQPTAGGWIVQRLVLTEGSLAACDRRRAQVHDGLPRALLGRALEVPAPCARAASMTAPACQDTSYARWVRLREVLLPRLNARGTFGFANFRKALVLRGHQEVTLADKTLFDWPLADTPPNAWEFHLLDLESVAAVLLADCGLQILDEDLALLGRAFGVSSSAAVAAAEDGAGGSGSGSGGDGGGALLVDVDLLADALRGEPCPGRHTMLFRLFAKLQREAGVKEDECLDCGWLAERLWEAMPREKLGQKMPPFTPDELLGCLPLLRTNAALTRANFLRWAADLVFHIPGHMQFAANFREVWGHPPEASAIEERLWRFLRPAERGGGESAAEARPPPLAREHRPLSRSGRPRSVLPDAAGAAKAGASSPFTVHRARAHRSHSRLPRTSNRRSTSTCSRD